MRVFLLLALLAGCQGRPADALAVDACALREYEAECSAELLTPDEVRSCEAASRRQALRIAAGIPAACRQ